MLRHYHETSLLVPEQVDDATGYRSYVVAQLTRLHRLLALRDLGFTLDQIGEVLATEPSVDELRGMLRMRRAQIEQTMADDRDRLARVEAHLRALEGSPPMSMQDVVVKYTDPLRLAESSALAEGFGPALESVFAGLFPEVISHLVNYEVSPGLCVAYYEEPGDDGSVMVHAGFDVGGADVPETVLVRVVDLPVIEVASVVHRGNMIQVGPVYEALVRWIEESGYRFAGRSRELYHESDRDDTSRNVTEIQMPIDR